MHLLAHLILQQPYELGAIIIPNLHRGTNWSGGEEQAWPLDSAKQGSSPVLLLTSYGTSLDLGFFFLMGDAGSAQPSRVVRNNEAIHIVTCLAHQSPVATKSSR